MDCSSVLTPFAAFVVLNLLAAAVCMMLFRADYRRKAAERRHAETVGAADAAASLRAGTLLPGLAAEGGALRDEEEERWHAEAEKALLVPG